MSILLMKGGGDALLAEEDRGHPVVAADAGIDREDHIADAIDAGLAVVEQYATDDDRVRIAVAEGEVGGGGNQQAAGFR